MTLEPSNPGALHNPFAIRAVYRPYGLSEPVYEWAPDWPLVPWLIEGHHDLWAPVDHSEEQFARFVESGPQPLAVKDTMRGAGHVVVVSGDKGSGKTSLIHRCVDHLARRLAGPAGNGDAHGGAGSSPAPPAGRWALKPGVPGVRILTLGDIDNRDRGISRDNSGQFAGIGTINQRIRDAVLKGLRADPGFAAKAQETKYADLDSGDLWAAYNALSGLLVALEQCVLVIVPDIPWRDRELAKRFLRTCSNNVNTGIVFFVESSSSQLEQDLVDEFGDISGTNVTHLRIGGLRTRDCTLFIERRLIAEGLPSPRVAISAEAVAGYLPDRHYRSVKDLQNIFYGVSQEVIKNGEEEVGLHRLRLFQELRQPSIENLGRSR